MTESDPTQNAQDATGHGAQKASEDAVVRTEKLCFSFSPGQKEILTDIDFELRRGVFLGLIGPNGGGKTTFLRLLLGEVLPTSGSVSIFGKAPDALGPLRAKIGYVPQKAHFDLSFPASAYDVVLMGSYFETGLFHRVPRSKKALASDLMARFGIADLAKAPIGELSYGQQQRVFIARALMSSPELLILDEPTTGVDTEGQTLFYKQVASLNREFKMTVLIVSHDIAQIADYVGELACLFRTMHWHTRSELINEEVINKVYSCELEAYLKEHLKHIEEFHGRNDKG